MDQNVMFRVLCIAGQLGAICYGIMLATNPRWAHRVAESTIGTSAISKKVAYVRFTGALLSLVGFVLALYTIVNWSR